MGSLFESRIERLVLVASAEFPCSITFMSAVPFHVIFFFLYHTSLLGLGDLFASSSLGQWGIATPS